MMHMYGKRWFWATAVVLFLLVGCSSGPELIYKVDGAASEVNIAYRNQDGDMELDTVRLPWETAFNIDVETFRFEVNVDNPEPNTTVACEVWIGGESLGRIEGVRFAECDGAFQGDSNTFATSFGGRYDKAP